MKKKEVFKYILLLILVFVASYYIYNLDYQREEKTGIAVDKYDDTEVLLIVSDYEDVVLWASSVLDEKDVLVVCLTCGNDEITDTELLNLLTTTNDEHLFLGFNPYNEDGSFNDWIDLYDQIDYEINKIVTLRHWDNVYTHNPSDLEDNYYHKLTSRMVTTNAVKERQSKNLQYFEPSFIYDPVEQADKLIRKEELLNLFSSKDELLEKYEGLIPIEGFIKYE